MIRFTLPMHPVPFARPRFNKGRGFNEPRYAAFKNEFRLAARKWKPTEPLEGPLRLEVDFQLVPPKGISERKRPLPSVKPDLDNFVKAVKDALCEFWNDDAQVVELRAQKYYSWTYREPMIIVQIEPIPRSEP